VDQFEMVHAGFPLGFARYEVQMATRTGDDARAYICG